MPGRKPSRVLPALLVICAFVVLGVLGMLVFIGASVDPREAAASDFGRRLMEMPEFEARYGDVDSPEEAYQLGQQVGLTAFARLDEASLLRYWQLMAPSDADVEAASLALANAMGIDQLNEAASALQDPTADNATVCGATRSFIGSVLELEDPHRATFLRYMASP